MKRLWGSLRIFWLSGGRGTRWRCEGRLPCIRRLGRDLCRFRLAWLVWVWWCYCAPTSWGGWFIGRCVGHRWSVGRHRIFFLAPGSRLSCGRWPSRRGHRLRCLLFWAECSVWGRELRLIRTFGGRISFKSISKYCRSIKRYNSAILLAYCHRNKPHARHLSQSWVKPLNSHCLLAEGGLVLG